VSQPNVNMYRPGSVTCPAFCHVILLTTDQPFLPKSGIDIRRRGRESRLGAGPERSSTLSDVEGGELQTHFEGGKLQSERCQRQPQIIQFHSPRVIPAIHGGYRRLAVRCRQ
jgi:hypothetical protein